MLLIQEAEALSAELSTFRSWMLRVLSLAVVILFLLSYVVAAWLTEPIRKIIAALKQITPRKRVFALTYRRQDEIGTPYCVTVDFESLEDQAVTIRDRDSMEQIRVPVAEMVTVLREKLGAPGF